ncbi:MAG: alpha/beta hydrolase fold domain-containing protein [Candidatus Zixiibacteriota bacterium]
MKKCFLLAAIIIVISIAFSYESYLDIPYYPEGEAPQIDKNKLDIFTPSSPTCGTPTVFFVHGGTWMYGDRRDYRMLGQILADEEELITVIISYRLSDSLHPEVTHPDHIEDVAQAFHWTYENIGEYGGTADKIFVMGHSAGAHLSTLLGTNTSYLEATGSAESQIQGIISFSLGVYDMPGLWHELGSWAPMIWPYLPFGEIFTDDTLNWYDASPKYHRHEGMPPFVFFVAQEDMEHIIGGDIGDMGLVILDGEVDDVYNDFNEYHDTDTFWLEGDHTSSFENFAYDQESRARILAMDFIGDVLEDIVEKPKNQPTELDFKVSPNPFNSACRIDNSQGDALIIRDLNGRIIKRLAENDNLWIPEAGLSSGIYLLENPENGRSQKIVYQK